MSLEKFKRLSLKEKHIALEEAEAKAEAEKKKKKVVKIKGKKK